MRYEDQQLIREYNELGLQIAEAKNPNAKHDVSREDTLKRGYLMLKRRMEQLSPKKKAAFRAMLIGEIRGVQSLIAKAKASGETFSLADVEIEMKDLETGEAIPDRPNVQQEQGNDDTDEQRTTEQPNNPGEAAAQAQPARPDDAGQGASGAGEDQGARGG